METKPSVLDKAFLALIKGFVFALAKASFCKPSGALGLICNLNFNSSPFAPIVSVVEYTITLRFRLVTAYFRSNWPVANKLPLATSTRLTPLGKTISALKPADGEAFSMVNEAEVWELTAPPVETSRSVWTAKAG